MPAATELARLQRDVEALIAAVELDLKVAAKSPMPPRQRMAMRSAIEDCIKDLDELRNRLAE
jgi:hypothetical protein